MLVVGALVVGLLVRQHRLPVPGDARNPAQPLTSATGSPSPPRAQGSAPAPLPDDWVARAPWALSALPDCFRQIAISRGSAAYARAHLPRGLAPVGAGTLLEAADCRVRVYRNSAIVTREPTVLFVPPSTGVFASADGRRLALFERHDPRAELRVYFVLGDGLRRSFAGAPLACPALARACLAAGR